MNELELGLLVLLQMMSGCGVTYPVNKARPIRYSLHSLISILFGIDIEYLSFCFFIYLILTVLGEITLFNSYTSIVRRSSAPSSLIMPGEVITEPNPKPQPSHLPDYVENLSVKLNHKADYLDQNACDSLLKFRRAAAYIAAGENVERYILRVRHLTSF